MKGKLIMTAEEAQTNKDKWLEIRSKGIGGSDIASIMGLNPWKSAYALWAEKTGLVEPEDKSNVEAVYWGTVLEDVVANRFCELTGKKVRRKGTMADDEFDYMLANVDRMVDGENAGLECKTASNFKGKEWADEEIPDAYYCQCQWYIMVTGCEKWYIACLIGGQKYVWKEIKRNEEDIKAMREAAVKFWGLVQNKIPPEVDGSESTAETISKLHPNSNDMSVSLPMNSGSLLQRWDELTATEKVIKEEKTKIQSQFEAFLGNNERGEYQDRVVSWKQQAGRTTIDSKRLKAERPDIFTAYAKIGNPIRVFRIK